MLNYNLEHMKMLREGDIIVAKKLAKFLGSFLFSSIFLSAHFALPN